MRAPSPTAEQGWDEATFSCGRCGAKRTATTEDDYLKTVGAHQDAHAVFDRLNQIERDGLASILRVILADADLGLEFFALMDLQHPTTSPTLNPQEGTAP
ncbi:hypothetical protein AB0D86_48915 [Streptomyces sp. NPDC048324]|uniref:hypothetical protein n=1 Tax=Streptomyces sp. NPDC048324 TaxID=3157205 RepID=UPI00342BEB67